MPSFSALTNENTSDTFVTDIPFTTGDTEKLYVMDRPPDPVVALPSKVRSSQIPTLRAEAASATLGTVGTAGRPTTKVSFVVKRLAEVADA